MKGACVTIWTDCASLSGSYLLCLSAKAENVFLQCKLRFAAVGVPLSLTGTGRKRKGDPREGKTVSMRPHCIPEDPIVRLGRAVFYEM